ncbi:MAG: hypothetical protein JXK05_00560 [Campylobacterales bacterium]|nr:hypothetical protein [Campylobacterales bacterium]
MNFCNSDIDDIIAKKIIYRRNDNLTRDIIDIAVAITHGDNTIKRLFNSGALTQRDIYELFEALRGLDRALFLEELEIVNPFETYRYIALEAPEIIKEVCSNLITH